MKLTTTGVKDKIVKEWNEDKWRFVKTVLRYLFKLIAVIYISIFFHSVLPAISRLLIMFTDNLKLLDNTDPIHAMIIFGISIYLLTCIWSVIFKVFNLIEAIFEEKKGEER